MSDIAQEEMKNTMLRTLVNTEAAPSMRTMEDWFESFFGSPSQPAQSVLPVDISEKEHNFVIRAAVPGVDPKNLQITLENNILSIRGETKNVNTSEGEKIYRREVFSGTFSRSIRLPEKLDLDNVKAEFEHGMVTITVPRMPEAKPRVLQVEVKNVHNSAPQQIEATAGETSKQ
jgi:HSP20 family protein